MEGEKLQETQCDVGVGRHSSVDLPFEGERQISNSPTLFTSRDTSASPLFAGPQTKEGPMKNTGKK